MILIKKSKLTLHGSFYINPNPPMYVLQTQHEHLEPSHSLMFYLNFTNELPFSFLQVAVVIIVVLCML